MKGGVRVEAGNARPLVTSLTAGGAFGLLEQCAKELWWTATRLANLGHLNDGTTDAHPRLVLAGRYRWNAH
ncbi:MAG: hypothetical protein KDJ25_06055 [Rhodoblastus sp.]|nr:hypothetical protein [Rhodoblastus sp.]